MDYNIDDIVSPSDQMLIDLAGGLCDDMGVVKDIFSDRNNSQVTTSFVLGTITTAIERLSNIKTDPIDLVEFLAAQAKKHGEDE